MYLAARTLAASANGQSGQPGQPGQPGFAAPSGHPHRVPGVRLPRIPREAAIAACLRMMGVEPHRIEFPGGLSRCSVRAITAQGSMIVTRRKHAGRAALEAGVMRELHSGGAPVPAVLAFDGEWLIQQDLGDQRLALSLGADSGAWAARAAAALLLCQRAAEQAGLAQRVAPIGLKPEWLAGLLASPARIAARLDLACPDIETMVSPHQLAPLRPSFVKWDARPGNAMRVDAGAGDGGVGWIDWEHCGARDALDDLAWLLCDEYMPDDAGLEAALLKRFLPLFALQSRRSPADALDYLSRFGTLHTSMRLALVLERKADGPWWGEQACARADRIGVTAAAAHGLCRRGVRWSGRWSGGERMRKFFMDADQRLHAAGPVPAQPVAMPAAA